MKLRFFVITLLVVFMGLFHPSSEAATVKAFADLEALRALGIPSLVQDEKLAVGVAILTPKQQQQIADYNHERGRCGGFEVLKNSVSLIDDSQKIIDQYRAVVLADQKVHLVGFPKIQKSLKIETAVNELKSANLRSSVNWLSAFNSRSSRANDANAHVLQLQQKIASLIAGYNFAEVSVITHRQTAQKSLRLRLKGSTHPNEIVVLGGHLDSINMAWGSSPSARAPGADDNASGSANLLEAARVLLQQGQPARSVDFFWYAAEEAGLIGSSEIAQQYKSANQDVIGVLQLDMTLFAGSGELTISSITDNTTPWLRDLMLQLNEHYVGARFIEDSCGYACSDHASWYRQGFPTVLPAEAATRKINKKIHSADDAVNNESNFNHSLAFSKLALAFSMELANSSSRKP